MGMGLILKRFMKEEAVRPCRRREKGQTADPFKIRTASGPEMSGSGLTILRDAV
jgi:hypothetical protein